MYASTLFEKNAFSKASWDFTLLHTMFHFKMECWKNTFSCVVVIAIMPKRLKGVQLNFFLKKNVIPDFNAFFVCKKSSRAPTLFQHVHVHYMWVDKESSTNLNKLCTTVIDAATKAIKYCTCCHFYHMLLKDQSIYWHVYLTFIFLCHLEVT